MKPIIPPDHDAIAQMAIAVQQRLGAQAIDFARRQMMLAEADMVTVWAAILTHLEPSS